jgi:hypothetical protein
MWLYMPFEGSNSLAMERVLPCGKSVIDLLNPPSAVPSGMVSRVSVQSDGQIDFRIGNWNCNTGLIRMQPVGGVHAEPTLRFYRPTGMTLDYPNPEAFAWWLHMSANPVTMYTGALEFRSMNGAAPIGS